jgi:hypothetical protein
VTHENGAAILEERFLSSQLRQKGDHIYVSEMGNRRLWNQNTGGRYTDSSQ